MSAFGIPVIESHVLRDGDVILAQDLAVFVGMRPLTDLELAGEQARYIVRTGLADVLAWLGESVGPAPRRSGRGDEFLASLRTTTDSAEGDVRRAATQFAQQPDGAHDTQEDR